MKLDKIKEKRREEGVTGEGRRERDVGENVKGGKEIRVGNTGQNN